MLDIKFIRDNADLIRAAARKKQLDFKVEDLLAVDAKRLKLLAEVEALRAEQHKLGAEISAGGDRQSPRPKEVKQELKTKEAMLKELVKDWQTLMLRVPNIPDISVPEGQDESGNVEVLTWGHKPKFHFTPRDHVELMVAGDMVDFERGAKVHGFRGYFLRGAGAELSWAIWNYARDFFGRKNYLPFIAPVLVRKEYFYGTGHLPREAEDLFKTQDDDYLSGTAEVPMMAYHADEILPEAELPKRYLAFSPCFRREAGSHGKDIKGLVRVHEFYKLEQLILSRADHAESAKIHEEINRNYEEFLESLSLPYRRVLICGGDLGQSKVKQYDTEIWFPSQNAYREGSSASYYHDFQTRRFNIRYRGADGQLHFAHSANCTAIATPRIIAALVENYQQADGSVKLPAALEKYAHFSPAL